MMNDDDAECCLDLVNGMVESVDFSLAFFLSSFLPSCPLLPCCRRLRVFVLVRVTVRIVTPSQCTQPCTCHSLPI